MANGHGYEKTWKKVSDAPTSNPNAGKFYGNRSCSSTKITSHIFDNLKNNNKTVCFQIWMITYVRKKKKWTYKSSELDSFTMKNFCYRLIYWIRYLAKIISSLFNTLLSRNWDWTFTYFLTITPHKILFSYIKQRLVYSLKFNKSC